jgi:glycosyltransferase involved in cell wall biosynthesis
VNAVVGRWRVLSSGVSSSHAGYGPRSRGERRLRRLGATDPPVAGAVRDRICIVRQAAYYEMPVRREADALRDAGYDVDVVCLREAGGPATEVVEGVTLHRLPLRRRRGGAVGYLVDYVAFFAAATVKVARLHHQRPFVAVQANTMPDILVFTALFPRLRGAKVVAFMKEPTPELGEAKYGSTRLRFLLELVEKGALRFADRAFTVTEDLKETYVARGADPDKITVVLNGPDGRHLLRYRTGAAPDPDWFTAVCHGLVDERYGHDTMVRAVGIAAKRIPDLRLRIMGEGEYVPALEQLIRAEGLADRVRFLGWLDVPDLVDELSRADVGVVAQKSSPYSDLVHTNKMYDYILFQNPVIASRLRSTVRYFGEDAVQYFEPGSAESLADALVALHEDPQRRRSLVVAAGELCRSYGWEAQKKIYLSVYAALLGRVDEADEAGTLSRRTGTAPPPPALSRRRARRAR